MSSPVCRRCSKPKEKATPGSITQWISVCDCDKKLLLESAEEQSSSIHICVSCGKRMVGMERSGSFTQWIFRSNLCACAKPVSLKDDGGVANETSHLDRSGMTESDDEANAATEIWTKIEEANFVKAKKRQLVILTIVAATVLVLVPLIIFFYQNVSVPGDSVVKTKAQKRVAKEEEDLRQSPFGGLVDLDNVTREDVIAPSEFGPQFRCAKRVTMKDALHIKELIQKKQVRALYFSICDIEPEIMEVLADEQIVSLIIQNNDLNPQFFKAISKMKNLETLTLNYCSRITAGDVSSLKDLKSLKNFSLHRVQVCPDIFDLLSQLHTIKNLAVVNCIPKKLNCSPKLAQLKALESLDVTGCEFDDTVAKPLPTFKHLRQLSLSQNKAITGVTLKAMCSLPIVSLSIGNTSITGNDLIYLKKMPLTNLDLTNLKLDDSALKNIAKPELERLNLKSNNFSDKGMLKLSMVKHLRAVNVSLNPRVTAYGINYLSRNKWCEVVTDSSEEFPLMLHFSN